MVVIIARKSKLLELVARSRWNASQRVSFKSHLIAVDLGTLAFFIERSRRDPDYRISLKTLPPSGDPSITRGDPPPYLDLTGPELEALADHIDHYLRRLFAHEATLGRRIADAKTDLELDQINTHEGWPT